MKTRTLALALVTLLLAPLLRAQSSSSSSSPLGLSVDAGTTGIGASLWVEATSSLVFNVGYAQLDADESYSTDGVSYDGSLDLSNGHALLQWHPGAGNFFLAAGAVLADNSVGFTGSPENGTTYEIGGQEFDADQVGSLIGTAEWENSVAPYFGLGWSKSPGGEGWGAFIDFGVMLSGSAEATLSATGPLANDPDLLAALQQEEQDVNDELDEFELYPVIRAGLMYQF